MTAISLLLLAVGVGAAWYVNQLQRNLSELLAQHIAGVRASEKLEIALREMRAVLTHFLITHDPRHLQALPALRQETTARLREADRLANTAREQELVRRIEMGYEKLTQLFGQVQVRGTGKNDFNDVVNRMDSLITDEILPPAHEYLTFNEDMAERASEENRVIAGRVVLALVLLGVCGGAAGVLTGYVVARHMRQTIIQLDVPIRDAAGKLSEVVGPITVSTAKGLADLEGGLRRIAREVGTVIGRLQSSQREMLRREQLAAVGQLAAGMAHELRNPLTAMKILVQSSHGPADDGGLTRRDLEVLEEEIVRMEGAIRTFLDFARPPQLEKRPIELRGIIEQTLTLVSARAQRQGAVLESALPGGPLVLEADVGQMRQVLLNLLVNALDAVPGGGTIRVEASLERADGWLVLRVGDTGEGLPPNADERIFEPFFSTKETGIGLGLPISRQIIEAHGGSIEASDRPGGGAVFTCRLPLSLTPDHLRDHVDAAGR